MHSLKYLSYLITVVAFYAFLVCFAGLPQVGYLTSRLDQ